MSAQVHTPSSRPILRSWWLVACVLLTLLQVKWAGYELGVGNQSIQVPFLLRMHDPSYFARDQMVQLTLDQYPSLFYRALAKVITPASLPWVYLWLHLLTTAGVFLAVVALCSAMFKDRWAGLVMAAMLLAGHHQALAEQTLYSTGFTHTWLVFPLVIGALALLYAGRTYLAFALAGIIFNIHAIDGAQLGAAMALWAVITLGWRRMAFLLAIFAICALPTLWFIVAHRQPMHDLWMPLMHVRSAQHSFPSTWWRPGQQDIPRFLIVLAAAGLSISVLPPGPYLRKTLLLALGVVILFVIGFVFTEIWPHPLVIRAQLFRSSRFLMVLALACIAAGCRRGWSGNILEKISATLVFACLAVPPWLILLPWVLLLATGIALINRRLLWQQACVVGAAVLIGLMAWRTIDFAVPGLSQGFSWKGLASWHKPALGNDPAWVEAQLWARDHTPKDALFLTPAQVGGFRVQSQRAVVGEWRDGTQLFFSTAYAAPWWQRMNALQPGMRLAPDGKRLLVQGRSIAQMTDQQIIELAGKFEADFVVLPGESPRTLKPMYSNAKWTIYRPEFAPQPLVAADTLDEQQRFMKSVVVPNIEKNRTSYIRLQLLDQSGRPLHDARYRILPALNPFFDLAVINDGTSNPSDQVVEFSSLTTSAPPSVRHAQEKEQATRLGSYAAEIVDRHVHEIDYWQVTNQGLFLDLLPTVITNICTKHPGLKLGISVAPRLASLRLADRQRGLDDIRQLKAQGIVLDFVTIQAHQPWGVWADPKVLYEIFNTFAREDLRIHVTGFEAPTEGLIEGTVRRGNWTPELQAEYTRLFLAVCYSHPAVEAVSVATPLEKFFSREWLTETNGTVALDGIIPFRGFRGTYVVEVTVPGSKTWRAPFTLGTETKGTFRFQLNAAGELVAAP